MKLISWNVNRRASNWPVLADLMDDTGATAAMIQEAVAPPDGIVDRLEVVTDPSQPDSGWRTPIPPGAKRLFASAVAAKAGTRVNRWRPRRLDEAIYGQPAISHPGQWVAAKVGNGATSLWVVSLYGLWESMPNRNIYAQATLHRALSDLAPLFQDPRAGRIVVAGDLNIWRGYGSKTWRDGYDSVFDRFAAYGFTLLGPFRSSPAPLAGCPCGQTGECRHVQTYRSGRSRIPYQTDFVFFRGRTMARCTAMDGARHWSGSDHCPILIDIDGSSA